MSLISTLRANQRPWARTVLAMVALVWLNLALQPCVMAATVTENSSEYSHHQEEGHAATHPKQHESQHHCPHCAVVNHGKCADGNVCGEPDVVQPSSPTELKDNSAKLMAMLPALYGASKTVPRSTLPDITTRAVPPSSGLSLSIRYCVYLK